MAQNRISKTPERNCKKMTVTRKAKIQKKKEQREKNRNNQANNRSFHS